MTLDDQIMDALKKLRRRDADTVSVLREFAASIGTPVEREVVKHTCSSCGVDPVLCFQCKARETLGDQASMALPLLLPKLALMVKQWAGEALSARAARKAAEATAAQAAAQQAARAQAAPPPPAGKQVF